MPAAARELADDIPGRGAPIVVLPDLFRHDRLDTNAIVDAAADHFLKSGGHERQLEPCAKIAPGETRMRKALFLALALPALVACQPQQPAAKADYHTDLPMTEYMGHVVDPAAFMYWRGSGYDITEAGEQDLSPTTDEGWDVLVTGASILIEAGNTLQLPHRAREPVADWNRLSKAMSDQAWIARAAAEKRDKQAVFDEGGKLYQTCVACHDQFVIDPEMQANGPAKADPLPNMPAAAK
jgi:hypothetical protein